jgi:hypothetical protein
MLVFLTEFFFQVLFFSRFEKQENSIVKSINTTVSAKKINLTLRTIKIKQILVKAQGTRYMVCSPGSAGDAIKRLAMLGLIIVILSIVKKNTRSGLNC